MMKLISLLLLLLPAICVGCHCHAQPPQPQRPSVVGGWKGYDRNSVHVVGEFVLKRGESAENGKVGVTIAEIIPAEPCANPNEYLGSPKVVFRFYRVSDHQTSCEEKTLNSGNVILGTTCAQLPDVDAMSVHEVNTQEGWVHFELLGKAPTVTPSK